MRNAAVSVLASLAVHAGAIAGVASLGLWAGRALSDPADTGVRIVPDAGSPVEIEFLPPPQPVEEPIRFDSHRPTTSLELDPPTFEPFVEAPAPEAAVERDRLRPIPAPPVFDPPPRPTLARVVAAAAVEAPPAEIHNPPPEYPALAVRRRWEGSVVVGFEVRPDGTCADIGIVQSSGYAVLDEAAARAVRDWRFKPAVRDGIPVSARQTIRFTFRLEK
jgi:protein TonB